VKDCENTFAESIKRASTKINFLLFIIKVFELNIRKPLFKKQIFVKIIDAGQNTITVPQ
jgi:hypothetical protein